MKNILLHGDNYDGLLYLAQDKDLTGKVKLVYIDPPYGTNQDFTVTNSRISTISRSNNGRVAYKDTLTGDDFLEFLRERLALVRDLLSEDGSIYLHIDTSTRLMPEIINFFYLSGTLRVVHGLCIMTSVGQ